MYKNIYSEDGIALGYVVPEKTPNSIQYLSNLRDYNDINADIKKQIKLSNQVYLWEGLVSTAVNSLTDFAVSHMKIKGLEGKAKQVIDFWLENVNADAQNISMGMHSFNQQTALEWFLSGNPFVYKGWDRVKTPGGTVKLPTDLLLINPQNITIPEESVAFGGKILEYEPTEEVASLIEKAKRKESLTQSEQIVIESIPKALIDAFDVMSGKIILPPEMVSHIPRKGRNYLPWGVPYLTATFSAVAQKRKLQLLDQTTTEGLINSITIFKIGDPNNEKTWSPGRIRAFYNIIKNPSPTLTLVWAYDVDVISVGPDGSVLQFDSKFAQADRDIIAALGIPVQIFTGEGKADQFTALAALMERLADFRDNHSQFVVGLVKDILKENNIKHEGEIRVFWEHSRLKNEKELRELVLTLWDRGLISIETALEEAGQDIDIELNRKQAESKIKEIFAPPEMPFSAPKPKRSAPDNSGDKGDSTQTKKPGSEVKDGKTTKAALKQVYGEMIDGILELMSKESNKDRIIMHSMVLPIRTETFIKNMIQSGDTLGIKVDKLLRKNVGLRKDQFIHKIMSLSEKKSYKKQLEKEMKSFAGYIVEQIDEHTVADLDIYEGRD